MLLLFWNRIWLNTPASIVTWVRAVMVHVLLVVIVVVFSQSLEQNQNQSWLGLRFPLLLSQFCQNQWLVYCVVCVCYDALASVLQQSLWNQSMKFVLFFKKFSFIKDERRQKYAAMVTSLDHSVGAVRQALADKGMLHDSVIIFTTDNGGAPYGFNW